MAVLRKEKKGNFTVIDNAIFKDYTLSMKAKGLLCQMLSLPDNWDYSIVGLTRLVSDGESAVRSTLKELEDAGYFRREQVRENGKIVRIEYVISESKKCDFPHVDFPQQGFPQQDFPQQENQGQLKTNESITDSLKTDISNTHSAKKKKRSKTEDLNSDPSLRPTLEDVESYIREKGLNVDARMFYDYFDASEWIDSKGNPVRNWKQKLITWSKNSGTKHNDGTGDGIRQGVRGTVRKREASVADGERRRFKPFDDITALGQDE